jgi:hypothetical protein
MRGYMVNGPSATGTANKTAVSIVGATTTRIRIGEATVGLTTAPNSTDQQLEFGIGRWTTSAGTAGTAPTPNPVDPNDVASTATAGITHSAEPTYAATYFMDQAMNQRAMFRWVAIPGYEWVNPATATTGIGVKNIAITATSIILGTVLFYE